MRMLLPRARAIIAVGVLSGAALYGLHTLGLDQDALKAVGIDIGSFNDTSDVASADAQTLDWIDLIPPQDASAAARLRDGSLPRGVVQHGELGPTSAGNTGIDGKETAAPSPAELAAKLGGYANLDAPPRRLADTFGGLGNLRALQPPGGSARLDLDGKEVRIAGFVTPLGFNGTRISEFLLVPYVGACIHVPPPPANQIVLVSGLRGFRLDGSLLYPVWVTGTLRAVPLKTDLADVGYQIEGAKVERYE